MHSFSLNGYSRLVRNYRLLVERHPAFKLRGRALYRVTYHFNAENILGKLFK